MAKKKKPRTQDQIRKHKMERGYQFIAPAEHNAAVAHRKARKASRKRVKAATLNMQRRARALAK